MKRLFFSGKIWVVTLIRNLHLGKKLEIIKIMKKLKLVLLLVLLVIVAVSCKDDYKDIELSWVGNPQAGYTYSFGVPSNWYWKCNFVISGDDPANVKMTASGTDSQETCEQFVEPGVLYEVSVYGGITSTKQSSSVFLKSPCFDDLRIVKSDRITKVWIISIKKD